MGSERKPWRWFWGSGSRRDAAGAAARSRAHVLLEQQRLPEAEEAYRELMHREPDKPAGLAGLGWVAMQRGEWRQALDLWNQCLARFSSQEQLSWHMARCRALAQLGMLHDAEAGCRAAAGKWPMDVRPLRQLISLTQRDQPKTVALLDELIARVPGDFSARLSRARILAALGSPQECRKLVESLLVSDGGSATLSDELLEQVLGAIQICCLDDHRTRLLERLGERARGHVQASSSVTSKIICAQVRMSLGDYEETRRIVRELMTRGVQCEPVEGMARVCERYFAPSFPDASATKVFCIGLSKTGTTSLDQALKMLGLQTLHWANPYTKATISEQDLFLFDGYSDIGISWQFERLYATFPNARFIYTTRSIESWLKSMTSHYLRTHGVVEPKQLRQPAFQQRFNGAAGLAEMNLYGRHDTWEESYREFDHRVRQFFADKPADKLLELAICEGEGWEKLCPFLDVPVPAVRFPVKNATP